MGFTRKSAEKSKGTVRIVTTLTGLTLVIVGALFIFQKRIGGSLVFVHGSVPKLGLLFIVLLEMLTMLVNLRRNTLVMISDGSINNIITYKVFNLKYKIRKARINSILKNTSEINSFSFSLL